jgi:hypothetical protein
MRKTFNRVAGFVRAYTVTQTGGNLLAIAARLQAAAEAIESAVTAIQDQLVAIDAALGALEGDDLPATFRTDGLFGSVVWQNRDFDIQEGEILGRRYYKRRDNPDYEVVWGNPNWYARDAVLTVMFYIREGGDLDSPIGGWREIDGEPPGGNTFVPE